MSFTAKEHLERFKKLETDRTNWDEQWQDCSDYAMPNNSQIISERSDGEVLPDLFDTIVELA